MEVAFEKLAEHGIMGLFLIMSVVYFIKEIKQLKEGLKEKDAQIQLLNDQARKDAVDNISVFKDTQQALKDLITQLKAIRNG